MTINVQAVSLEDLLRSMPRDTTPAPLSEQACIALLRNALEAWDKPNPFRAGDIVRPAKHSAQWQTSLGVCIVYRCFPNDKRFNERDRSFVDCDMTLLTVNNPGGQVREIEAHSRDFELVTAAGAEA